MSDDPTYVVTSLGLTLTGKDGKEKDLKPGDTIKRSELLTYTRAMYIDAMLKAGDLKVADDGI